ncbi:MAG TPA: RagB/SusD family nutrient uptake outer membrane protein, partial [Anseongella sp.]|nr:RagB/SusD family nutrient uptake outer membrane protein [Anseongella sp.]
MKRSKIYICALLTVCSAMISCDSDLLDEEPKGFLSPDNVFTDKAGFESATANLYRLGRALRTAGALSGEGDKSITAIYGSGTDLGWYWDKKLNFGDYSLVNPTNVLARDYWNLLFRIVKDANVIISRLGPSPLQEEDKQAFMAEARFFRAYAYRFLVYLYGDVPKIEEEFTAPKVDFTRTPRSEILAFMIADLEFASQYLPAENPAGDHLSKAAADHLLAETYIAAEDYDNAVAAATRVIDDGQYQLMTARFGTYANKPGDVFWDLFRLGNQNRSSGNTESILVWQMEFGVPGGDANYSFERAWAPYIEQLVDSHGNKAILPSDTLGRGVGFFRPSEFMETELWQSDFSNDIRNSRYNMQREFYNNNPASPEFGQVIVPRPADIARRYYVWVKKASHPHGHPQGYDQAGRLYSDIYAMRLAETYLLRAEAHFKNNDPANAAADINALRLRAQASPVMPGDVTMDY